MHCRHPTRGVSNKESDPTSDDRRITDITSRINFILNSKAQVGSLCQCRRVIQSEMHFMDDSDEEANVRCNSILAKRKLSTGPTYKTSSKYPVFSSDFSRILPQVIAIKNALQI